MRDDFTDARRKVDEPNSSPETVGTRCDGCDRLSCIRQDKSRLHPWRYYCSGLSRSFTIAEVYKITKEQCPEHRDLPRRRFK